MNAADDGSVEATVRPYSLQDLDRVVALQRATLPEDFWSGFDVSFLRVLHEGFLRSQPIAFVAVSNGVVIGFVVGSAQSRWFSRVLLLKPQQLLLAISRRGLRQPRVIWQILRRVVLRLQASPPDDGAVLMYLAVDPGSQRAGIGRVLVDKFVQEAARRGATRVRLKTVKFNNEGTNAFYRALGFHPYRESVSINDQVQIEYEIAATTQG